MDWQDQNKDLLASSLPVIPRLDRLDLLVQILEEKHGVSGRHLSDSNHVLKKKAQEDQDDDDEWKKSSVTLSTALEQVHHKGTLMERLTALENRVLQLSLEMDEGNTSRSSSSKSRQGSFKRNEQHKANLEDTQLQEEASVTDEASLSGKTDKVVGNTKVRRNNPRKPYGKWLGWLHVRC